MILLAGMAVANLAGGVLFFAVAKLSETYKGPEGSSWPSFSVAVDGGLIAAWFIGA